MTEHAHAIYQLLAYIQEHLEEPLTLQSLATLAGLSPFHFHRIFSAYVGETVSEYIRRLRLEKAAMRLEHSKVSITAISLSSGYETPAAFAKAFKQHFGKTPSEWRKEPKTFSIYVKDVSALFQEHEEKYMSVALAPEMRTLEDKSVLYCRRVGAFSVSAQQAWDALIPFALQQGLLNEATEYLGLTLDNPKVTDIDKLRYDACITLTREVKPEGEFMTNTIPGGRYAVFTHKGSYTALNDVYGYIFGVWLPQSGEQLRDTPGFERYVNNPKTAPEEALLTEIYVPV